METVGAYGEDRMSRYKKLSSMRLSQVENETVGLFTARQVKNENAVTFAVEFSLESCWSWSVWLSRSIPAKRLVKNGAVG